MKSKQVILFDDVFFQFSPINSGVSRIWIDLFTSSEFCAGLSDMGLELVVLSRSGALEDIGTYRVVPFPTLQHNQWALDCQQINHICESLEAKLFVSSYFTFPTNTPTWTWCYDLIPERLGNPPDLHYSPGWQQRQMSLLACRNFASISMSTRDDLNAFYPHSDTECGRAVAYPWLSSVFRKQSNRARPFRRSRLENRDRQLLMVGSRHQLHGYKNGSLVFRSIEAGVLDGYRLVCVGGEPFSNEERQVAESRGVPIERVLADDIELAKLYRDSSALVYPSRMEGFGLPVIEALACGIPVICQRGTSLGEAGGDCAIYLKDDSVEALAEAIELSESKYIRESIEKRGPIHAQGFTPEMSINTIVKSLASALERGEPCNSIADSEFNLSDAVNLLADCQI